MINNVHSIAMPSSPQLTSNPKTNSYNDKKQEQSSSSSESLFDLETYVSRYDSLSHTLLQRLLFLVNRRHAPSSTAHTTVDNLTYVTTGSNNNGSITSGTTSDTNPTNGRVNEEEFTFERIIYSMVETQLKEMGNVNLYKAIFENKSSKKNSNRTQKMNLEDEISNHVENINNKAPLVHDTQRHVIPISTTNVNQEDLNTSTNTNYSKSSRNKTTENNPNLDLDTPPFGHHDVSKYYNCHHILTTATRNGTEVASTTSTVTHAANGTSTSSSTTPLVYDESFVNEITHSNNIKLATLEGCLSQASSHLAKESIRQAYMALAEFHRIRGNFTIAVSHLLRAKEYCSHVRQISHVILLLAEVSLETRNFIDVIHHVNKAEYNIISNGINSAMSPHLDDNSNNAIRNNNNNYLNTASNTNTTGIPINSPSSSTVLMDITLQSQLALLSGIAHMSICQYKKAAMQFLSIHPDFQSNTNSNANSHPNHNTMANHSSPQQSSNTITTCSIASSEDIALYGGLLALASLDRLTIQTQLLGNGSSSPFSERLELVPPIRNALHYFVRADYSNCLNALNDAKRDWIDMDMYLNRFCVTNKHSSDTYTEKTMSTNHYKDASSTNPNLSSIPSIKQLPKLISDDLLQIIKDRLLVQYYAPYSVASLHTMTRIFQVPGQDIDLMEKWIVRLIHEGKIVNARIDSPACLLRSDSKVFLEQKKKHLTKKRVLDLGLHFKMEMDSMLFRLSCIDNNVMVVDDGTNSITLYDTSDVGSSSIGNNISSVHQHASSESYWKSDWQDNYMHDDSSQSDNPELTKMDMD